MKSINLFLGIVTLTLIYFIVQELYNNKKYSLYSLLVGSVFPPLITYTAVVCSENLAMHLYLLSIYLFLKSVKNRQNSLFCITGIILAFGNLFRMIATVILIAYAIFIILYYNNNLIYY